MLAAMTWTGAFETQALPHQERLFRQALRLTGKRADAHDLVQDTLVKAWLHFAQFDVSSNCAAWLSRILTNTFLNGRRRAVQERNALETQGNAQVVELHTVDAHNRKPMRSPEALMGERQLSDEVMAALAQMPPDASSVLVMAELWGMSYKEISEALGVPAGTVMSRLSRARKLVKPSLLSAARDLGLPGAAPVLRAA